MNLQDIMGRTLPAEPWSEGENIPWNDPDFSRRMLAEHLNQAHNLASRRFDIIDRQVQWIHGSMLEGRPTRILDLTCGPGFYTGSLARLGHACQGIDYAPAALKYAQEEAARQGLSCTYRLADVRKADYGEGYGLVMMLFGQLNVFRRADARLILEKACRALAPEGRLLIEPQRFETVEKSGKAAPSWYSREEGGLFSDRPHLCLTESFWNPGGPSATQRFFVIDTGTGEVARHALTSEAYTEEQYRKLLAGSGFGDIRLFPSLTGIEVAEESQSANLVFAARKQPAG
jgi:SAM-dependent methyltransferase